MRADELDVRARLRAVARELISDLRHLGVEDYEMQGLDLMELRQLKERRMAKAMAAPGGR